MIIVTGTKRSGTSMWMQTLKAAGLEVHGDEFPKIWGETIREANKHGFYESDLREGIYHLTNPSPKTGRYMHPSQVRRTAVKVFIPGLARTDLAFVHRVLGTVRNWREYSGSLNRLFDMEDAKLREMGKRKGDAPVHVSPLLEWWLQNYMLVRDVAIRGLPAHFVTYDRVLADPANTLPPIMKWLGIADDQVQGAIDSIDPTARTQAPADTANDLTDRQVAVFDEFYGLLHEGESLPVKFLIELNKTHMELVETIETEMSRARKDSKKRRMTRMRRLDPDTIQRLSSPNTPLTAPSAEATDSAEATE